MKLKIYIAGKVTGDPKYKEKFAKAELFYQKKGYTVLNPARLPLGMRPADYMRICFAEIDTADVVSFLPDYVQSTGARLEYEYCLYTGKNIRYMENDMDNETDSLLQRKE